MTFLVDCGVVVKTLPETLIQKEYRLAQARSTVSLNEDNDALDVAEPKYREFKFLTIEDGNSIYISNTSLLPMFQFLRNRQSKDFIKPDVEIFEEVMTVLKGYSDGFKRLWNDWKMCGEAEEYKEKGLDVMFQQIATAIRNRIKG